MISFKQVSNPTRIQLMQFGFCLSILLLVDGIWGGWPQQLVMAWIVGAVLVALLAWKTPLLFRMPFIILSCITLPIGIVVGELVLLLIYFLVVTPIGLIMNVAAWKTRNSRSGNENSNWEKKRAASSTNDYLRQF